MNLQHVGRQDSVFNSDSFLKSERKAQILQVTVNTTQRIQFTALHCVNVGV